MQALSENTIKNQVYRSIFTDIINNQFHFDQYLTERELMEKYHVSRAPVREALMQLRSDKFIISVPRHGYRIRRPNHKELMEIAAFRSCLECKFLEEYHGRLTNENIEELRKLCESYDNVSLESDFLRSWSLNREFHLKLFSYYGNTYCLNALADAIDQQVVFYVQIMQKQSLSADFHFAMLDYIDNGNIHTASTLLRADIEKIPAVDDSFFDKKKEKAFENAWYSLC